MSSEDVTPVVSKKTAHEDAQPDRLREERWCATCHALMWICASCSRRVSTDPLYREWEHCANCGGDFRPVCSQI